MFVGYWQNVMFLAQECRYIIKLSWHYCIQKVKNDDVSFCCCAELRKLALWRNSWFPIGKTGFSTILEAETLITSPLMILINNNLLKREGISVFVKGKIISFKPFCTS